MSKRTFAEALEKSSKVIEITICDTTESISTQEEFITKTNDKASAITIESSSEEESEESGEGNDINYNRDNYLNGTMSYLVASYFNLNK